MEVIKSQNENPYANLEFCTQAALRANYKRTIKVPQKFSAVNFEIVSVSRTCIRFSCLDIVLTLRLSET